MPENTCIHTYIVSASQPVLFRVLQLPIMQSALSQELTVEKQRRTYPLISDKFLLCHEVVKVIYHSPVEITLSRQRPEMNVCFLALLFHALQMTGKIEL